MELEKRDKNELDGSTPGPPPISPTLVQYTQTATQYPSQAPPDYYYVAPQLQHGAPPYGNSAAYPPQRADTHLNVVTTVPILSNVCCSSRVGIPDQNRVVISGVARYRHGVLTSTRYTYADELPCRTSAMLVWLVMCVFLSTPVSLLCSVPGYYFIHRSNEEAKRGNIAAARKSYSYYRYSVGGLSGWFGIVITLAITLGTLYGVGLI